VRVNCPAQFGRDQFCANHGGGLGHEVAQRHPAPDRPQRGVFLLQVPDGIADGTGVMRRSHRRYNLK
jgi:hypothetical protein